MLAGRVEFGEEENQHRTLAARCRILIYGRIMRGNRASLTSPEALANRLTRLAWWFPPPLHRIPLYFADLLRTRL